MPDHLGRMGSFISSRKGVRPAYTARNPKSTIDKMVFFRYIVIWLFSLGIFYEGWKGNSKKKILRHPKELVFYSVYPLEGNI